jgi:hypothetical protein
MVGKVAGVHPIGNRKTFQINSQKNKMQASQHAIIEYSHDICYRFNAASVGHFGLITALCAKSEAPIPVPSHCWATSRSKAIQI